jgi:hypothetical protein
MLDPNHPERVDHVGFATGLRVRPYVLSELRLTALLEHHYGIPRDTRYINLGPEAARGRTAGPRDTSAGGATSARATVDASEECVDLIDEATFSSLHQHWNCQTPFPALEQATELEPEPEARTVDLPRTAPAQEAVPPAAALERELAVAADRDTVGRLALAIARLHADAAALFVVRGGMIAGFCGDGSVIRANIDGILIPVDADSIFAGPAADGNVFRGVPLERGLDGRVLAALGRRGRRATLVLPIAVRDRVINLLYVDAGEGGFAETNVAALVALCRCVGDAYERIVIAHKRTIG